MTKRSLVLGLAGVLLISGLSFAATQEDGKTISQADAEKIMLNKIPNGKIEKIYLDERDREYKAIVKKGNEVYEIEVDSLNGNITDFDKEYVVNQNNNSSNQGNQNNNQNSNQNNSQNKPNNDVIYDDDKYDDDRYDDKDDYDDKYDDDKYDDDHDDKYEDDRYDDDYDDKYDDKYDDDKHDHDDQDDFDDCDED